MPGDGAVMNVSANGRAGDERALGVELGGVAVGRRRRSPPGRAIRLTLHPLGGGAGRARGSRGCSSRSRISGRWLVPPKPGHAVLHVGEEALAGLLAVVADVDAGIDLGGDHVGGGVLDGGAQLVGVDASPRLRRPCSSASAGGRGRLPAWVVRMRDSLVSIGLSLADIRSGRRFLIRNPISAGGVVPAWCNMP